jgi:hypothetical protein
VAGFIEHCHKFRGSTDIKADPSGRSRAGIMGSNPVGSMGSVSCECCFLSGKCICNGPIPRPEESCRMCTCVIECDQLYE